MSEEDDDSPQLSVETFAALQEFYKEQDERQQRIKTISNSCDADLHENWQLSQFWYDEETVNTLCKITKNTIGNGAKVALISCPTLYKTFRKELDESCEVHVYEFDKRFSIFGSDFICYDYNNPLYVPKQYTDYYDLVIADPPFLSDECLTKTCITMKYIGKGKYILCTGAVMCDLANRLLELEKMSFEPQHKNNLANEFCCFSNYNIDSLL